MFSTNVFGLISVTQLLVQGPSPILPGTLRGKRNVNTVDTYPTRQTSKPATLAMLSMSDRSQAGNRTQVAAYIVHPRLRYEHLPARSYARS